MKFFSFLPLLVATSGYQVFAFTTSPATTKASMLLLHAESPSQLTETVDEDISKTSVDEETPVQRPSTIYIPLSFEEMVKQISSTMEDAMKEGKKRQTLRILLPRSSDNDQFGQYFEKSVTDPDPSIYVDTILVPPDETWQGGIMQLYRAASLACQEILRRYSRNAQGGVVPRLQEDRSFDESGVDGVGLWLTQGASASDDVSCFVQPSQETIDGIDRISSQAGERMVALINPQWRIVDDALDAASKKDGIFGQFASFLGGKGNSLRRLDEMGFENIYIMEGYVCRGGNVRLMKRFDTDWYVFAQNDAGTDFIECGSSKQRPSYQDVDKMLDDKGISLKYARDIGLAPKL
eukprot:CAMPEP_0172385078 /NCGR_PEP_ID=MMETSP1061-20121228/2755_1 /TAXON_ID=37318 /ORGANISM="Pseudo-nitzschia pungens, Strain cf. pungens" /LENGTH=349 /DNA_ID=CAMNT_0013113925 /DNA_START=61 /DNA_END=1110 /DNA_ORIENTATION=-